MSSESGVGLERVPSGVAGLDEVMQGGFFAGGVYIVRGAPGAGKTILANQICFGHARRGGRAVYVTLLAESHARMLQHMELMSFYDPAPVPRQLYFVSGFTALEQDGLKGLMDLLRREMRGQRAGLLVLDGLLAVEESSGSDREFRKFIHELQAHAAAENCLVLLLTNGSRRDYHPEHTMVDGLITLEDNRIGKRTQRELEVRKFRGSGSLRGKHSFRISDDGISVFPRAEARFGRDRNTPAAPPGGRTSSGIAALDAMIGGGFPAGSSTLIMGPSGTGKTSIGLHFISCSSAEEPGLFFGFYETPEQLMANAAGLGLDLHGPVERGELEILWRPAREQILDELAGVLIEAVKRRGVKRLVVDGIGGFIQAADLPERLGQVFTALSGELMEAGVSVVYMAETPNLVGPSVLTPIEGISAVAENCIMLRYVEARARLHRLLSVLKMRASGFDLGVREFAIGPRGIDLADTYDSAQMLLVGSIVEPAAGDPMHPPPRSGG